MLKGVGVGDESATAAAATITWILKDGSGMIGRILFAWYQGTSLDCDAKRWRLFADILNDLAICIELVSPLFPSVFVIIACVSSVFRSIVGVAGGATRAALTMHQARRNNMADVSAKDGSQETLVNLAALLIGLIITPLASGNYMLTWSLFFMFTFLHLYANYRAVTCVVMETLNQTRLHLLVQVFLQSPDLHMLSPAKTNAMEPVLWKQEKPLKVNLGSSLATFISSFDDLQDCLKCNGNEIFLFGLDIKKGILNIVLHEDITVKQIIKACFQAEVIQCAYQQVKFLQGGTPTVLLKDQSQGELIEYIRKGKSMTKSETWEVIRLSARVADHLFPRFLKDLEMAGWKSEPTQLCPDEWRARWNLQGVQDKKIY
ncbi:RUS family member 1-like [Antedon mediterranea]|uniref:RUS family member 1-like n=1 Tax=Antedon mediterranea TaxID=105859 RepID=UPI003AF8D0B7